MDDYISRQQAIDKIKKRLFETAFNNVGIKQNIDETLVDVAENRLENWSNELPSIQPERKTGKWIYGEDDGQDGWYCSECNGFVPWDYEYYGLDNIDFIRDFKICPFCDTKMITYTGADMRGEAERCES